MILLLWQLRIDYVADLAPIVAGMAGSTKITNGFATFQQVLHCSVRCRGNFIHQDNIDRLPHHLALKFLPQPVRRNFPARQKPPADLQSLWQMGLLYRR